MKTKKPYTKPMLEKLEKLSDVTRQTPSVPTGVILG